MGPVVWVGVWFVVFGWLVFVDRVWVVDLGGGFCGGLVGCWFFRFG